MKQHLVIHVDGLLSDNCQIYLTNEETTKWWRLGLIRNIKITATSDSAIPEMSFGLLGLSIVSVDIPKITTGNIIFIKNFSDINDKNYIVNKGVDIPSIIIFEAQNSDSNLPFYEQHKAIGGITKLLFEVDVNTRKASLKLEKIEGF